MKCTQCGCTEFISTSLLKEASTTGEFEDSGYGPFRGNVKKPDLTGQVLGYQFVVTGDANGDFRLVGNCDCFVCKNCGHIELFAKGFVEKHEQKRIALEQEKMRKYQEEKQFAIDLVELKDFTSKLSQKLNQLEQLSLNEDISVKKHNEVVEQLKLVKQYLPICEELINKWSRNTAESQRQWYSIKSRITF